MLPGEFLDKVTFDIDFTDEAVVQCDVPVNKNSFVGDANFQMINDHKHILIWILMYSFWTQSCL